MALASSFGAHFHTLFPLDSSLPPASPYASCLGPRSLAQSPPRPRLANHSPVPPQSSQRGAPPTDFEKKRFLTNIFSRNQYNQAFLSLLTLQSNSVYCESEPQSIFWRAGRSRKKIADPTAFQILDRWSGSPLKYRRSNMPWSVGIPEANGFSPSAVAEWNCKGIE